MKTLLIVYSYHHNNTQKIGQVIANQLNADIMNPLEVDPDQMSDYDLIGFGSGIYSGKHHESLLSLVDRFPPVESKYAFIFSTAALTGEFKTKKDHEKLCTKLQSKGYCILEDFSCKGFNTNSFLKYFGGMNKGRPNDHDLKNAQEFAEIIKEKYQAISG